MPVYRYRCASCEHEEDGFNRVAECESAAPEHCGARMRIAIQPVMGHVQANCHYVSPLSGKPVYSHRARRNEMAEHRVVDGRDFDLKGTVGRKDKTKADLVELASQLPMPPPELQLPALTPKPAEWNKNTRAARSG